MDGSAGLKAMDGRPDKDKFFLFKNIRCSLFL